MKSEVISQFNKIELFVWNYSIAGHGKGAPDGIGALIKRKAGTKVAQGHDITNVMDLYHLTKDCKIQIFVVREEEIKNLKTTFKREKAVKLKGIMKTHQVIWRKDSLKFEMNSLPQCILLYLMPT